MKIGVVHEVKLDENRVALTPSAVHTLVDDGHDVLVESGAGLGSRITDDDFATEGATIVADAESVWGDVDLMVKVKEPQQQEFGFLSENLTLFTYLHLAAYPAVAAALCDAGCTAVAYETVQLPDGSLPLLAPMSEVAGRMAVQVGAHLLERAQGGRGVLMGGVPGVDPAKVVVIGAGMAGSNAVQVAVGMGADVDVFDVNPGPLRRLDAIYRGALTTKVSHRLDVRNAAEEADLVIGAVLLPGAKAPRVLTAEDLTGMHNGAVLVDISIDQGGCFETSRETKHSDPTYVVDGVVHYAVGNIPGAVPRTSTYALTNVTLPYVRMLADHPLEVALQACPELEGGVNTRSGEVVHSVVAAALAGAE